MARSTQWVTSWYLETSPVRKEKARRRSKPSVSQQPLQHLAVHVPRQRLHENRMLRLLVVGDVVAAVVYQRIGRRALTQAAHVRVARDVPDPANRRLPIVRLARPGFPRRRKAV